MSDYTTGKGVYKGWYWRFVGLAVLGVILLQIISFYTIKWPILESTQIAMFLVIWLVISRIQERRLANAIAGSVLVFVIGLVLQFTLDPLVARTSPGVFWKSNLMILVVSILLAYLYAKMQGWSERKRDQLEAKRKEKMGVTKTDRPPVRTHRKKKRRK